MKKFISVATLISMFTLLLSTSNVFASMAPIPANSKTTIVLDERFEGMFGHYTANNSIVKNNIVVQMNDNEKPDSYVDFMNNKMTISDGLENGAVWNGPSAEISFAPITEYMEFSCEVTPKQANDGLYIMLKNNSVNADPNLQSYGPKLYICEDSHIRVYYGESTNEFYSLIKYNANEVLKIKMLVNVRANTYTIYINGIQVGIVDMPFYNRTFNAQCPNGSLATKAINSVLFQSGANSGAVSPYGIFDIDNVMVKNIQIQAQPTATLVNETFDTDLSGFDINKQNGPNDVVDIENGRMKILDNTTDGSAWWNGVAVSKTFAPQNNKIEISMDMEKSAANNGLTVYLKDSTIFPGNHMLATKLYFCENGYIRCYDNDSSNSYQEFISCPINKSFNLKMVVDIINNSYDVYIDNTLAKSSCKFYSRGLNPDGLNYRATNKVDTILIQAGINTGITYIDNLVINSIPLIASNTKTLFQQVNPITVNNVGNEMVTGIDFDGAEVMEPSKGIEKTFYPSTGELEASWTVTQTTPGQTYGGMNFYLGRVDVTGQYLMAARVMMVADQVRVYYHKSGINSYYAPDSSDADKNMYIQPAENPIYTNLEPVRFKLTANVLTNKLNLQINDKVINLSTGAENIGTANDFYNRSYNGQTPSDVCSFIDRFVIKPTEGGGTFQISDLTIKETKNYDYKLMSVSSIHTIDENDKIIDDISDTGLVNGRISYSVDSSSVNEKTFNNSLITIGMYVNGKLADVKAQTLDITNVGHCNGTFNVTDAKNTQFKVFIWDENQTPLTYSTYFSEGSAWYNK